MKTSEFCLRVFAIMILSTLLQAQDVEEFERLGQVSMAFLDIDVGARAVGMGSAFTCIDNDVNSLFWNPAGVASIQGGVISLSNCQWIADINQYAFAAALGTGRLGTFGISLLVMDNGEIENTIPNRPFSDHPEDYDSHPEGYQLAGTYSVQQWAAGLAYARRITDKFSVGGQLKYCYEDFGEYDIVMPTYDDTTGKWIGFETKEGVEDREGVIALDFGTLYYFGFKDLRIAMSLRNFSQGVTYAFETFNLPITYKVAIAMNLLSVFPRMENHNLQITCVTVSPHDGGERVHLGCEYTFRNLLALRGGYRANTDIGALSAGFGLTPSAFGGLNLHFDYAYSVAESIFGSLHRFSFGFAF
ncbi:MAG: PorV/PorQ family protein [Fidelibacterota bacterium]|nr:MAG: PorV/PorQ family protein [Candidatus Neomarinimicrobiota bacterium]